jgi:uncharacterized protein (TIRG00374 family)
MPATRVARHMDRERLPTVAGFLGALVVMGLVAWVIGVRDLLASVVIADPRVVALIVLVAVGWLSAWGLSLRTVLGAMGTAITPVRAVLVFAGAVFANNVTPFGQAGGEPVTALLLSSATDTEYEHGLAAIASVDALHFVPSLGFAAVGLTFVVANVAQLDRNVLFVAIAVLGLALVLPTAALLGWRYRYELETAVVRTLTPVIRAIGRVVPRLTPPTAAGIERRIEYFFLAIDRVAADRRGLLLALAFSALGWLGLCLSLWLSLFALGHVVPFAIVLLVVPAGSLASVTPLPGGLGGIETVLIALLVSTTPTPAAAAGAGVLLHRLATYWLPTAVGGGVATKLGATRRL